MSRSGNFNNVIEQPIAVILMVRLRFIGWKCLCLGELMLNLYLWDAVRML
jgi:hypothetical protein